MLSNFLTNKILITILATLLAVFGGISAVVLYNVHQANEYHRRLQKGLADANKQIQSKPASQYQIP